MYDLAVPAAAGLSNQQKLKPVGVDVSLLLCPLCLKLRIVCIYLTQVFDRTVASDSKDALAEWMKYASPEGIIIVLITSVYLTTLK